MSIVQAERPRRSERKARGSGHLRRAELLAAAQKIFNTAGYEGATIRRIAEEVGVSSTALYMYFQDKSQIMLELCVQALEGLNGDLEAIAGQGLDPRDEVRALLQVMLRFGFEQPTTYQLLYCVAPKDISERRHDVIGPLSGAGFDRVIQAVEKAAAAGRMRNDMPARSVAEAMVSAAHGLVTARIANPLAQWSNRADISKVMLDGLFEGFGAK